MARDPRIVMVTLDDKGVVRLSPEIEHERKAAILDLIDENRFTPVEELDGPYHLHLRIEAGRLVFDLRDEEDAPLTSFALPLGDFRPIIKDYFVVCESYFDAIKTAASPSRIEAIDMGRRGLHNEGSQLLLDRLAKYASVDLDTARRLFTLMCVLHIRA